MSVFKLPIVVCGEVIECGGRREEIRFDYENGTEVVLPCLDEGDLKRIAASRLKTGLSSTGIDELTEVFSRLGRSWGGDCENRRRAVELCSLVTGYPAQLVERDYLAVAGALSERGALYDQLDSDLGSCSYLEDWLINKDCLLHASPWGIVTNILVGNIPLVTILGAIRCLLVKNNSVCKLPKRDPAGAIFFALELCRLFPGHPVTKSLTVAYFEKDSPQEKAVLAMSDVLCLWGGESALGELRKKARFDTKILDFGPKRSLSLVDLNNPDESDSLSDIALRVAQDFSLYDQEACFSPQDLCLVGGDTAAEAFVRELASAMDYELTRFPKDRIAPDNAAHVLMSRKEALFDGERVIATGDHRWTLIFSDSRPLNHPLSRTVYIHRLPSFNSLGDFIDAGTQTVALYPWREQSRLRDAVALLGASRLVAVGMTGAARTGFTHDGIKPFSEMVRWVSVERDIDFAGKYSPTSKRKFFDERFKA